MERHDYEKRRFIEAFAMAVSAGRSAVNASIYARDIVNKAGEVWDEIEHQYPRPEEKNYNE